MRGDSVSSEDSEIRFWVGSPFIHNRCPKQIECPLGQVQCIDGRLVFVVQQAEHIDVTLASTFGGRHCI